MEITTYLPNLKNILLVLAYCIREHGLQTHHPHDRSYHSAASNDSHLVHGSGVFMLLYLYLQEVRLTAQSGVFFGRSIDSSHVVCVLNNSANGDEPLIRVPG